MAVCLLLVIVRPSLRKESSVTAVRRNSHGFLGTDTDILHFVFYLSFDFLIAFWIISIKIMRVRESLQMTWYRYYAQESRRECRHAKRTRLGYTGSKATLSNPSSDQNPQ